MMFLKMMAKHRIRSLPSATAAVTRSFCSANSGGGEDKRLYRRITELGVRKGRNVEEVMEEWVREGKAVTESKLVNIVKELRRYKNYKHALKVIDWMEKSDFDINVSIHAIRLDLISKYKGVDRAEKYFSNLPEVAKNQMTYGALLNCYCQEKIVDKALALYEKMKELNIASHTLSINNLMALYFKLGQHEKLSALFEEMKDANITPDRITYGILMTSCASKNDIESIERIVEEMKKGGRVTFDWSLCCNLAGYYNSAGLYGKAELSIRKAEKLMPHKDRDPYHYLITLYAGAGNLSEVKRVWKLLKTSFGKMTNISYYHMFHALRKLDDIDCLKRCFEEWESTCVTYDVKLVNLVIDAYLRKGMVKEAERLWKMNIRRDVGSDFKTLELFTNYYLEKREMDLAAKFLERFVCVAKQEEWVPDKKKVRKFLNHLKEVNDVEGVKEFCRSFETQLFHNSK